MLAGIQRRRRGRRFFAPAPGAVGEDGLDEPPSQLEPLTKALDESEGDERAGEFAEGQVGVGAVRVLVDGLAGAEPLAVAALVGVEASTSTTTLFT